jgi:hypothetical protein
MKISYRNSFTDIFWFTLDYQRHSPVAVGVIVLLMILVGLQTPAWMPKSSRWFAILLMSLVAMAVCLLACLAINSLIILLDYLASEKPKQQRRTHTITLSEDQLLEESPCNRTATQWSGLHGLRKSKKYIFAYVTHNSGHVIPRRAFASPAEWNDFSTQMAERYRQHLPRPA